MVSGSAQSPQRNSQEGRQSLKKIAYKIMRSCETCNTVGISEKEEPGIPGADLYSTRELICEIGIRRR